MIIRLYKDLRDFLSIFNYKEGTETVAFGKAMKAEKSLDMSARGTPKKERRIVRFGVLSFMERGLDSASPLDKEKHKALYYNKAIRT